MKELKNITDIERMIAYRQLAYRRNNGPITQLGRGCDMRIIDEEIAEMMGALIGDGCISRYRTKEGRIRTYLLFTGHSENDLSYYENVVIPIFIKQFGKKGRLYIRKDTKSLVYWVSDRKAISHFIDLGFPIGRKPGDIKIIDAITCDKKLSVACVRGVFNTDGCIYRRYTKRYSNHSKVYDKHAVIQFKMKSKPLLEQISQILISMDIKPNRIIKTHGVHVLRITEQKGIHRFMYEFSINHQYHLERYNSICNRQK